MVHQKLIPVPPKPTDQNHFPAIIPIFKFVLSNQRENY